jgi:serine/threonine-protein kinase HipA
MILMTTSKPESKMPTVASVQMPKQSYVWVWLPSETEPVVAGVLNQVGDLLNFNYGTSYLARKNAIPLYLPELPLQRGLIQPLNGLEVAGAIRDAGPDAWGQRVILAHRTGKLTSTSDTGELSILTYLLESGSNRIGGLDFQISPTEYVPRVMSASLSEMQSAAELFMAGQELSSTLADAFLRGSSIGGARPKVLLSEPNSGKPAKELIAKFSISSDPYPVVKAEAAAMDLAGRVGLNVAKTQLAQSLGHDVLLINRFDRPGAQGSIPGIPGERRLVVSALTLLGLDEMRGRYATYPDLADIIRSRFTDPDKTLHELFSRIVFSICVGNTDDHARNHAAFWDGERLTLTPAYDLCPQLRSGETANQAMAIGRQGQRASRLSVALDAAEIYHLTRLKAQEIIDHQVGVITDEWKDVADLAMLTTLDRNQLWGRQILNPAIHFTD